MPKYLSSFGTLLCGGYVAAIGLPIFILPGYRATNLSRVFDPQGPASLDYQALRIHWIAVFAGLVVGYLMFRSVTRRRLPEIGRWQTVASLCGVFGLAAVVGLARQRSPLVAVYFVQTVIPVVGFLVGACLCDSASRLRAVLATIVASTTLGILLILAVAWNFDAFSGDMEAANRLARAIPQVRDYFPFMVAASLSLSLGLLFDAGPGLARALLAAAITVHLGFYAVAWSRMAVVMLVIATVTPLVANWSLARSWAHRPRVLIALAIVVVVVGLILSQSMLRARGGGEDFGQSTSARIEYAREAMGIIAAQPLFGRSFAADWDRDPRPARDLRIPRVFKAHNQYLDYGIRAGLPAVFLLGLLMWQVGGDLRMAFRDPALRPLALACAGALLAVAVGNLTQLFLVQAQTGSLAWLLMGLSVKLPGLARQDRPE